MRGLFLITLVVVVWLAGVWGAVAGGYDRGFLVPPPDLAAENFTRQITAGRNELALHLLASSIARTETPGTLRNRFAPALERSGKVNRVEAEQVSMYQDRAVARVEIIGDDRRVTFELGLVRESYLWKIESLPAVR